MIKNSITTRVKVIEVILREGSRKISRYSPKILFQDKKGDQIVFTSSISTTHNRSIAGEIMEIIYLEGDPSEAKVNSPFRLWSGPILFFIIGTVTTPIGIAIIMDKLSVDLNYKG